MCVFRKPKVNVPNVPDVATPKEPNMQGLMSDAIAKARVSGGGGRGTVLAGLQSMSPTGTANQSGRVRL